MKVVIYGGSGFIGAWITKLLLVNNFQITIFDKKINEDLLNRIIAVSYTHLRAHETR